MPDQFTMMRQRLDGLVETLIPIVDRDPEQEVQGMALPVLDAILTEARQLLPDDPVACAAREVVSVESIAEGEPVRAVDALIVARQLKAIVGREPAVIVAATPKRGSVFDRPGLPPSAFRQDF